MNEQRIHQHADNARQAATTALEQLQLGEFSAASQFFTSAASLCQLAQAWKENPDETRSRSTEVSDGLSPEAPQEEG